MVFESLINPIKAERRPWEMLFIGMIYSTFAIILSLFIFREDASLVMIFLTTLATVPLIYGAIKLEAKKDLMYEEEKFLIKEHSKALSFFMFLFMGFVLSFLIWYVFLPADLMNVLFQTQLRDIRRVEIISYAATGNAINIFSTFGRIFLNNVKVMVFSLLFSFFYGFGAIFILTWNSSVIGAAIGSFIRNSVNGISISVVSMGMLRYLVHGIPEILAYFMAGLAGGIISIAIIRHDFGSDKFKHIVIDSFDLILGATLLLVVAALLEVFVTPLFIF
ncbi:stage II sporulation protein M [Candidatus Woesearchaeota archaeon]|nr:stage II sporulation protein M [Candidatus Woesearchaeota archaeon]